MSADSGVSQGAPRCAERVLDEEVLASLNRVSVPNDKNRMIIAIVLELRSAIL